MMAACSLLWTTSRHQLRPTPADHADVYLAELDRDDNEEKDDHDEVVGVRPYVRADRQ